MEYNIKVSAEVWEQLQALAERHLSSVNEVASVILDENIDRYLASDGEEAFTEQQLSELRESIAKAQANPKRYSQEEMDAWLAQKIDSLKAKNKESLPA
jgi:hypothetical protein